jgi:hypothetical protein
MTFTNSVVASEMKNGLTSKSKAAALLTIEHREKLNKLIG